MRRIEHEASLEAAGRGSRRAHRDRPADPLRPCAHESAVRGGAAMGLAARLACWRNARASTATATRRAGRRTAGSHPPRG